MSRLLIMAGLALVMAGLIGPWADRLGLGRLPGDILIEREGVTLYFPITTALLISGVVSLLVWLLRK